MTFSPLIPPAKARPKFTAVASAITKPSKSVLNAIQSWRAISGSVFLFNTQNDLGSDAPTNVTYVTPTAYPASLKEMLAKLANETLPNGNGILVHEDVFIEPDAVKCLEIARDKNLGNAWAATAKSREYAPQAYATTGTLSQTGVAAGYSVFITTSSAFKAMANACPGSLRAGSQDAWEWMAKFCSTHIQQNKYHDIDALRPFWQPQKKKEPSKPENVKPIKGPQRRYV